MTATYTVVSSSAPSGRKSGKNSNGSYNKALKGYMCDLEKRYGRIPLSPDNARIPLGLSVGGGHHGMYLLNGALHQSPYGSSGSSSNSISSKSSRGQSRWSNASPVSSTNASAAHPSSPHDSCGNSSFSSHCSSLHSHMDGSDRFTQRSVMEDSVPTPPIASSSRRLAAMDYADGEDGDHDDFRAVPPVYDDEYDDNGEEKQSAPGRGSGSATGRNNTNRSRSSTTSSPSSSSSTSPRTRRKRKEKNRSHSGHSSSSPSSSTKSPSSSSNSSACRWEALVDDSSHRRGSHSCATKGGGSDGDRELDPSTLSPTKPSRSDSLVLDTLTEAIEIASSSDTTSKSRKLNRSKSSGSSRSDSNRRRGSRNSSSLSSSSSSRSRLASSSFNAKAPIRKEDKDRVISPPKRSNSSSPTIRTTTTKGSRGDSSKNSNPSRDSGSSSRRVPDVFLHSPY